ncbi:MAG: TlpA family protein disulfide reductase [Pyrinomonadaceae bacterium]|nr:TlpA family protein disulfide reductase [Pyrinomonadaceae bacterium]
MKLPISLLLTLVCSFALFAQNGKTAAEDFAAVDIAGQTVKLSDLKGKVVVLTFWSTKCVICHSEIPKLNALAKANSDKNVVFLGITMNGENLLKPYLKENPFNFRILPNSFGIVLKYADKDGNGNIAMGFPAHFLVDQNGNIELKTSGFDKTEKLGKSIERLLQNGGAVVE